MALVKKKKIVRHKGKVYDIQVSNTHTYNIEGLAVHNSAAGSLVSYCLFITDIDPIKYNILFERFLDESRPDMPDIDLDFHPAIRDKVKQTIVDEFGSEHTCSIATYLTYKTASVIIDCARACGHDIWEAMSVTKQFSPLDSFEVGVGEDAHEVQIDNMTFEELYKHYPDLKTYMENYPDVLQHSIVLRNQVKNLGKHAGGMIISNLNLDDCIPVYRDKHEQVVATWSEGMATHELSAVGLVKFDILGLKNLAIIQDAIQYIKESKGIELKRKNLDIDNKEAIKEGSKKDLMGVFQFENPATKPVSDAVKIESIEDISAVTSLIRPGPRDQGMDHIYAERKHGMEAFSVPKCIQSILKDTQGIAIYQDQVMLIAQLMCGFEPAESNALRRVLVKEKDPDVLEAMRQRFIAGAQNKIENGEVTKEEVVEWWDKCKSFAGYGFNKAHSISYSAVSSVEFWLKYNFFTEYVAALINNAATGSSKGEKSQVVKYINYARKKELEILPPSINNSGANVHIEDGKIRFALSHIKQLGKSASKIEELQPFTDLADFFNRVPKRQVNKRTVENLVAAGAFNEFGKRDEVWYNYMVLRKEKKDKLPEPLGEAKWKKKEEEILGLCLSEKPALHKYKDIIREKKWNTIGLLPKKPNTAYTFGRVEGMTSKRSRKGNNMMIVTITDDIDEVQFYVWEASMNKFKREIKIGMYAVFPLDKFDDGDARFFDSRKDIITKIT